MRDTVPADVDLALLAPPALTLPAPVAAAVNRHDVLDDASADEVVKAIIEVDADTLLMSAGLLVSGQWWDAVVSRMRSNPSMAGVYRSGREWMIGVPGPVRALTGQQHLWSTISGVRSTQSPTHSYDGEPITAVIIARDEEPIIARCIASALPLAEHVLVYDTGSVDKTRDVARAAGAQVVSGYWDDDFAAARNRAAAHAETDWVLILDADDVAVGDPVAVRAYLKECQAPAVLGPQVSIDAERPGRESVMKTVRYYRRSLYHYQGVLHESVSPRRTSAPQSLGDCSHILRFLHDGYSPEELARHNKAERNLRLARQALNKATTRAEEALFRAHLGRSLVLADRPAEGVKVLDALVGLPLDPREMVSCGRVAVDFHGHAGNAQGLEKWLPLLEQGGECPGRLALVRARLRALNGDFSAAAAELRAVTEGTEAHIGGLDPWGVPFDPTDALLLRAAVCLHLGDTKDASRSVSRAFAAGAVDVPLHVIRATVSDDDDLTTIARHADDAFLNGSVHEAMTLDRQFALRWFTAVHTAHPQRVDAIVAASMVVTAMTWHEAARWTLAAMEVGIDCNHLMTLAQDEAAPASERAFAYGCLAETAPDRGALAGLIGILEGLGGVECSELLRNLNETFPTLLNGLELIST